MTAEQRHDNAVVVTVDSVDAVAVDVVEAVVELIGGGGVVRIIHNHTMQRFDAVKRADGFFTQCVCVCGLSKRSSECVSKSQRWSSLWLEIVSVE